MSYLGAYQLGQTVTLALQAVNSSNVRTLPDRTPLAKVFLGATAVLAKEMPIVDRFIQTGFFQYHLFLSADFGIGKYQVVYWWTTASGAYIGEGEDYFEVMAGGHADGNVLSMYFYERPQAAYVVYCCEDGNLFRGRNPSVR